MKPLGLPHSSAAQIFAARYRARSLSWLSFGSLCRLSPPPLPLTILRPPFRDLNVHLRYFREMMDWAMTGIETYGYPPPHPVTQCGLSWFGCFDEIGFWPPYHTDWLAHPHGAARSVAAGS